VHQVIAISVIENRVLEVNVVYGVLYAGAWTTVALQLSARRRKHVRYVGAVRLVYAWELARIIVSIASFRWV
jgi:hypothetical protein